MSEDQKKEAKEVKEVKEVQPEAKEEAPQSISVEQIVAGYPIDRDRVRDTLLINVSTNLNRIANALEYFANQDMADRKGNEISKASRAKSP